MIILVVFVDPHFQLRNIIGRIRSLLSYVATAQLLHALIMTRIDYCNSLLYNLPMCSIARLQKIQNQTARTASPWWHLFSTDGNTSDELVLTPRCDRITEADGNTSDELKLMEIHQTSWC